MLLAESLLGSSSAAAPTYIEDVFSTYLYTGNSSTQTITNGIDLSTKGGLIWNKCRSSSGTAHWLWDTVRGGAKCLTTSGDTSNFGGNGTNASTNFWSPTPSTTGYSFSGSNPTGNSNGSTYVSWTFRKQPKFFDVVTYTGNGANRTIAHNLGSVPGCIMIKRTDTTAAWAVYHRSLANTQYMVLNTTAAAATGATYWNSTTPTASVFSLGTSTDVNASGGTYVAYLFAHNAGGFGASSLDNVISCGSFTTDGAGDATITLGYEPQWILFKPNGGNWYICDVTRGMSVGSFGNSQVYPNLADAEITDSGLFPTSTGFAVTDGIGGSATYYYIAIRRGPMRTPTTGTSVFGLSARTGTGANATVTGGQTDDAILVKNRGRVQASLFSSRLTGTGYLSTSGTAAEVAAGTTILQANPWDVMDGVKIGTTAYITNASADTFINYLFRRAPGFFDVVCYTGTGSSVTLNHNLGVAPELWIIKCRSFAGINWWCGGSVLGSTTSDYILLDTTGAKVSVANTWLSPTATTFGIGSSASAAEVRMNGQTYVAYLFATVAGVSKVGSYTGSGTTKQIDCGFTGGARFVLIKRTDSTGDWYVWDSARGIVAGNDPYLLLNSNAVEVTSTDYVDTYSAGFEISSTAPAAINANGGSFIFLAIA